MGVEIKPIEFPDDIKNKFENFIKRGNIDITYKNGNMVQFKNSNMDAIDPHKIILKTENNQIVILYYGQYLPDQNRFYIYDLAHPISWTSLKKLTEKLI